MANLDSAAARALVDAGPTPSDAVPFAPAQNAADITTTTAVAIKAGVALKSIYITKATIVNKTPAEAAVIALQSDNASPVIFHTAAVSTGMANGGNYDIEFNPPVKIAVGEGVEGIGVVAVLGDTVVTIQGFIGTP